MNAKPTGLAAFTRKGAAQAAATEAEAPEVAKPARRRARAQGETVALTVRLPRADWARLHQLAVSEGVSLQGLAVEGLSAVLAKHGLPPIEE
jgi:hypothetical protein